MHGDACDNGAGSGGSCDGGGGGGGGACDGGNGAGGRSIVVGCNPFGNGGTGGAVEAFSVFSPSDFLFEDAVPLVLFDLLVFGSSLSFFLLPL